MYTWSKSGWRREQKAFQKTVNTQRPYEQSTFDRDEARADIDLIMDALSEVQYGPVGLKLDELPQPVRQLMEATDTWHITKSGKLFRVVDPITQVQEYEEWGSDTVDAEINPLDDTPTLVRTFLEQAGIICPDCLSSEITDALANSIPYQEYMCGDDDEEDTEEETYYTSYEVFPDVPDDIIEKVKTLTNNLYKEQENLKKRLNEEEYETALETLAHAYEQAVNRLISPFLTTSLNSSFCGRGYLAPGRRHVFTPIQRVPKATRAAEEREKFFYELFGQAASCSTFEDLFGPSGTNSGGFYGKIRSLNAEDKELASEWSMFPTYTDKDGNVVESQFTIQRKELVRNWRENKKGDEESLRIALWNMFDRVATTKLEKKTDHLGREVEVETSYKDSIWRQKRTVALMDLNLTKPQWDAIYTMLKIIKQRIEPTNDEFEKTRVKTLTRLRDIFKKINNLSDLRTYMNWSQKRHWEHRIRPTKSRKTQNGFVPVLIGPHFKTYKFTPSLIDRITLADEANWRRACIKRRKELQAIFLQSCAQSRQIISIEPTDLEEITLICQDPKCDCMAIGKPQMAKLEDGRELNFIPCSGCSKPVWLYE